MTHIGFLDLWPSSLSGCSSACDMISEGCRRRNQNHVHKTLETSDELERVQIEVQELTAETSKLKEQLSERESELEATVATLKMEVESTRARIIELEKEIAGKTTEVEQFEGPTHINGQISEYLSEIETLKEDCINLVQYEKLPFRTINQLIVFLEFKYIKMYYLMFSPSHM